MSPRIQDEPASLRTVEVLRRVLIALIISMGLAGTNILYGNMPWSDHVFGYILIGASVALFGWRVDRLWYLTFAPMIRKTMSWIGFISRIPFWYFGGAVGYVLGLLIAKKLFLLTVYDIPMKPFFLFGGIVGIAVHSSIHLLFNILIYRRIYDTSRTT